MSTTTDKPTRVDIKHTACDSNKIASHGYCTRTRTLALTFKNGPGNEYQYPNVGQGQYEEFLAAESKGKFFGQNWQKAPFNKFDPLTTSA